MDRHLFTLTSILAIAITLIHKLVQSEAPIHQNSYNTAVKVGPDDSLCPVLGDHHDDTHLPPGTDHTPDHPS